MNIVSVKECENFVQHFSEVAVDPTKFLSITTQSSKLKVSSVKPQSFKTQHIADLAKQCISHLGREDQDFWFQERIKCLENLEQALSQYGTRVKHSIEHRGWYGIIKIFGYRTKAPNQVTNLLTPLSEKKQELQDKLDKKTSEEVDLKKKTQEDHEQAKSGQATEIEEVEQCQEEKDGVKDQIEVYRQRLHTFYQLLERVEKTEELHESTPGEFEQGMRIVDFPFETKKFLEEMKGLYFEIMDWSKNLITQEVCAFRREVSDLEGRLWNGVVQKRKYLSTHPSPRLVKKFEVCHKDFDDTLHDFEIIEKEFQQELSKLVANKTIFECEFRIKHLHRETTEKVWTRIEKGLLHTFDEIMLCSNMPEYDELQKKYFELHNKASELLLKLEKDAGIAPKEGRTEKSPASNNWLEEFGKLEYDLVALKRKVRGNQVLLTCIDEIEEANRLKQPQMIFGLTDLPTSKEEFNSTSRKHALKAHPDKHKNHAKSATKIFIIVDRAKKFLLNQMQT